MATKTEQILDVLCRRVEQLPEPQPPFELALAWASDYDGIFASRFEGKTDASNLFDAAIGNGRVLLTGRGGGAKSVILTRTAKDAVVRGAIPVLIRLRGWTGADYRKWEQLSTRAERLGYLLARFSVVSIHARDLDILDPSLPRVILLDGLNEVDSGTGQQMIFAIDEYARFAVNTHVVVSDRLVRREFISPTRWKLAVVLPLARSTVEAVVFQNVRAKPLYEAASESAKNLLTTPYFLNAFLQGGNLAGTIASQMRGYFEQHALTAAEIDQAALASFEVYADSTRTFAIAKFRSFAGEKITKQLLAAGAILAEGDMAYFDHHLKHDFLASKYVVDDPKRWTSDVFNTVTFHASSFETITMAMEQIQDPNLADRFLRSIYDWNIYAAGYSIAEGRETRVSESMRLVILAMFAERRWDIVRATAERAHDTLRLIETEWAHKFLSANSLEQVFALLASVETSHEWFHAWRGLFSRPVGSPATENEIKSLVDVDSVIGWTSANVLKRLHCSEEQQASIRGFLDSANPTVQWRATHVLGSFPSEPNRSSLIHCLGSESVHVRFGATRSLVEMAARSDFATSQLIFSLIGDNMDSLKKYRTVLKEFERAIFIQRNQSPKGWTRSVASAVKVLQQTALTVEDREHWDQTLARLVSEYGI